MKIEITKGRSPVADFFAAPLSAEGEADRLQLEFADKLASLMTAQGITRSELARRLGIQPSRVTAILAGSGNLTTLTKVRAARAVGAKYHGCLAPASKTVRWQITDTAEVQPALLYAESVDQKAAEVTFNIVTLSHDDAAAAA